MIKTSIYLTFLIVVLYGINACKPSPGEQNISESSTPVDSKNLSKITAQNLGEKVELNAKSSYFFLVRHAEKTTELPDTHLTPEGQARAKKLAELLSMVPIDYVYSSPYNRTLETAVPTAVMASVEVSEYDPGQIDPFSDELKSKFKGNKVLL